MGRYFENLEAFDPDIFKIGPSEAKGLDPQGRLLLEETLGVLVDIDWKSSSKNFTGLYGSILFNGSYFVFELSHLYYCLAGLLVSCTWNISSISPERAYRFGLQ